MIPGLISQYTFSNIVIVFVMRDIGIRAFLPCNIPCSCINNYSLWASLTPTGLQSWKLKRIIRNYP